MSRRFIAASFFYATLLLAIAGAVSAQENFWEIPQVLVPRGVRFSQSAAGGNLLVLGWQEMVQKAAGQGEIYISLAVSPDGKQWTRRERVYGPIPFSQPDSSLYPPVYSMTVDKRGRILIALAVAEKTINVIVSEDQGARFRETAELETQYSAVTPQITIGAKEDFLLFVTESSGGSREGVSAAEQYLSIYYSVSPDGLKWSDFAPFVTEEDLRYNFTPEHAPFSGKDCVVFQSRSGQNTFQLYMKTSLDGGRTWEKAVEITSASAFDEKVSGKLYESVNFTNQRPSLQAVNGSMGLAWERNLPGAKPQVYYAEIDETGRLTRTYAKVSPDAETMFGRVTEYRDNPYVLYSSTAAGRIYLAPVQELGNAASLSSKIQGASTSPHAVEFGGQLFMFWETGGAGATSLVEVRPDTDVTTPELIAVGFKPGERANVSEITVRWAIPIDQAGISAYRYSWDINGVEKLSSTVKEPILKLSADADGEWELSVTAEDFAGNKSKPAKIGFIRDTTPPAPVIVEPLETDTDGYLVSNTFTLNWSEPPNDEIAGYTYGTKFLGADPAAAQEGAGTVAMRSAAESRRMSFNDHDDGVWAFSVAAVDTAGNEGEASTIVFKLNKYIPYTAISDVKTNVDEYGDMTITISGRGFTAGGTIERIFISTEARPPYDYEFLRSRGDFTVQGDRLIVGPKLTSDVKSGKYIVGVFHPVRLATIWRDGTVTFLAPGTLKIGDFSIRYMPRWITERIPLYSIPAEGALIVVFIALVAFFIVLSARRMVSLVREESILREEVTALIERRPSASWEERKREMQELQKKGMGLRLKFTMFTVVLVVLIVLSVSVLLGYQMIGRQQDTLADGLRQRSELLIGSLATSAENQLALYYQGSITAADDMGLVPDSISAMGEEALWATITGPGDPDTQDKDYVWATNDPEWIAAHQDYAPGIEKPSDEISIQMPSIVVEIDDAARQKIEPLLTENDKNLTLYRQLIRKPDKKSQADARTALEAQQKGQRNIESTLRSTAEFTWIRSSPEFSSDSLKPVYLFYKPIVFLNRQTDADNNYVLDRDGNYVYSFFHGMVRLEISTRIIQRQIEDARNSLIRNTGFIALAAIGLGILGAIILANIIVTPIKKLAAGVAIIRDTADKKELGSHVIEVRTRDEIGMLADTVNDMTKGLVKAAIASEELMVGKDVQKMFLPLERDIENRKGTTGGEDNPRMELYGYYEGAKGVSGDYFDFKKLDDTHYALIKCDVAGKGVPAALIMVEVATLFINYFRDWVKRREELPRLKDPVEKRKHLEELSRVDTLVYTINDMIEERGFKGRFAALTICLFNSETGIATICNAGDKDLHLFEASQGRMTIKDLPTAPAAGVFPSMLVDMKTGFKQITQKLEKGDAMFLFTDGFVESKRTFRDAAFKVAACDDAEIKDGGDHDGTHRKGDTSEEFEMKRIHDVIDAVFNKAKYSLIKHHSPTPGEELVFDFSGCEGTVRETVLALVAVEKLFRLYHGPDIGAGNKVLVDEKVDEFMKKHFLQYPAYFPHRQEERQAPGSVTYTHLQEDDQYDDLTILVLRKK